MAPFGMQLFLHQSVQVPEFQGRLQLVGNVFSPEGVAFAVFTCPTQGNLFYQEAKAKEREILLRCVKRKFEALQTCKHYL